MPATRGTTRATPRPVHPWTGPAMLIALAAGTATTLAQTDCDGDGIADLFQELTWVSAAPASFNAAFPWATASGSPSAPTPSSVVIFDAQTSGVGLARPFMTTFTSVRGLRVGSGDATITLNGFGLGVTGNIPGCRETALGTRPNFTTKTTIRGDGEAFLNRLVIGRVPSSDATLVLDGSLGGQQTIDLWRSFVGAQGRGRLEIESSIVFAGPEFTVGAGQGVPGDAYINGPTAQLRFGDEVPSAVVIGEAGDGFLSVSNGATLHTGTNPVSLTLAAQPGSSAILKLTDPGTLADLALDEFTIGNAGQAILDIGPEAVLFTQSPLPTILARQPGSSADVLIQGPFGNWTHAGAPLLIGLRARAEVTVSELATLDAPEIFIQRRGYLHGWGTVSGVVTVAGGLLAVSPDPQSSPTPPRELTINGPLIMQGLTNARPLNEAGRIAVRIDAFTQTQSDQVVVNGPANLAGTLIVSADTALAPQPGEFIEAVVAQGGIFNAFDAVTVPVFANGTTLRPVYGETRMGLEVAQVPRQDAVVDDPNPFRTVGPLQQRGIVTGDVTGDGLPDLLVVSRGSSPNDEGRLAVLINLGTDPAGNWLGYDTPRVFSAVESDPVDLGLGDFNDDGLPDVIWVSRGANGNGLVRVRLNSQTDPGSFNNLDARVATIQGDPVDLAMGDRNGDKRPEAVIASIVQNTQGKGAELLTGGKVTIVNGTTFATEEIDVGTQPGSIDTSNSAFPGTTDIGVTDTADDAVYTLPNDGAGNYGPAEVDAAGDNPTSLDSADLDGDGLDDLLTTDTDSGTVSILRSIPGSNPVDYRPAVSLDTDDMPELAEPISAVFVDLDDDGDLDIAVIARDDGGAYRVRQLIFEGVGMADELIFLAASDLAVPGPGEPEPIKLTTADVDDDGDQDLVILYAEPAEAARTGPGTGNAAPATTLPALIDPAPTLFAPASVPLSEADVSVRLAGDPGCPADLAAPFGTVTFADISAFLASYTAQTPPSDLAAPFGSWTFADISAFLAAFAAGCP